MELLNVIRHVSVKNRVDTLLVNDRTKPKGTLSNVEDVLVKGLSAVTKSQGALGVCGDKIETGRQISRRNGEPLPFDRMTFDRSNSFPITMKSTSEILRLTTINLAVNFDKDLPSGNVIS